MKSFIDVTRKLVDRSVRDFSISISEQLYDFKRLPMDKDFKLGKKQRRKLKGKKNEYLEYNDCFSEEE